MVNIIDEISSKHAGSICAPSRHGQDCVGIVMLVAKHLEEEKGEEHPQGRQWVVMTLATVAVGIASGLGGMLLGLLLHGVQHLAYGYNNLHGHVTFLEGAREAAPLRRVIALVLCGVIAGVGWWAVYRWGKPLVSIARTIQPRGPRMPVMATTAHILLQIVTVGLGSPLGREVAPREAGAMMADKLGRMAGLDPARRRVLIACGAGAGLAAVYNVPLGGALFVLEGMLGSFAIPVAVPAIATSVIAALVAWIGLGDQRIYEMPAIAISPSLMAWSMAVGPVMGLGAVGFVRLTAAARKHAPRNWQLIAWCCTVFPLIGVAAIYYPELLGNGRGLAQVGLEASVTVKTALILLLLRTLVTAGAIRAGGQGGLLTPSLSVGAMLGIVTGAVWSFFWPGAPVAAFALIGAAAFLGSSMRMPATAAVLMIEFTHAGHDFFLPILLAVAGAAGTSYLFGLRLQTVAEMPRDRTSTLELGEHLHGSRAADVPEHEMH
jgi:H+/Cl- antiporter ClcA